jgi:hypothetical protein
MLATKIKMPLLGVLAAFGLCFATAEAQAQTLLRYKFKTGDKLQYVMEQKMNMKMDFGGQQITAETTQTVELSWNITGVEPDGKAKMTQRIDRIKFDMNGPPPIGKVEYDSKTGKEAEGAIGGIVTPIFKAMAGAEFTATMDARGDVSNIKVPEKLTETIKKAGGAPGFDQMFGEDALKQMVGQGGLVLPEKAVAKDATWSKDLEMKLPFGNMKVDTKYTYDGPAAEGGKMLEKITMKPKVTMAPAAGAQVAIKMKDQDGTGTALFDNQAGRLVETSMKQTMEMEINVGGMMGTQKMEQTATLKLAGEAK